MSVFLSKRSKDTSISIFVFIIISFFILNYAFFRKSSSSQQLSIGTAGVDRRLTCGSYWGFTVRSKVFAVPFQTCRGDIVPWPLTFKDAFPIRILTAAADLQVGAQGALISDRINATVLTQGVYTGDFICTQKFVLLAKIVSSVSETAKELFTSECISFRDSGQHGLWQYFLGRSLEYAAAQQFFHPLTSGFDFVVLPFLIANPSETKTGAFLAHAILSDLQMSGESAIFVSPRPHRDILAEPAFSSFNETFLTDSILKRGVYLSSESHPSWCWGVEGRVLSQLDGPYVSSVHARSFPSPRPTCSVVPWPLKTQTSSKRPIAIFMSSGARSNNYMRTIVRYRMEQCANGSSYPPGSCAVIDLSNSAQVPDPVSLSTLLYGVSKFCIHPVGDTPMRRAFYDSILMGCIPISLPASHKNTGDCNAPWHYANDVTLPLAEALQDVAIPVGEFESGFFIDRLLNISIFKLDEIQFHLAQIAHGLQYREPLAHKSFAESVSSGNMDAVDFIFDSIVKGKNFKRRLSSNSRK